MPMNSFVDSIKTLKGVGDDVIFCVTDQEFSLTCHGGTLDAKLKLNEVAGVHILCPPQTRVELVLRCIASIHVAGL